MISLLNYRVHRRVVINGCCLYPIDMLKATWMHPPDNTSMPEYDNLAITTNNSGRSLPSSFIGGLVEDIVTRGVRHVTMIPNRFT